MRVANGDSRGSPLLAPVLVSTRVGTSSWLTTKRPPLMRLAKRSTCGAIRRATTENARRRARLWTNRPTGPVTERTTPSGPGPGGADEVGAVGGGDLDHLAGLRCLDHLAVADVHRDVVDRAGIAGV